MVILLRHNVLTRWEKGERTSGRLGYRAGYYPRTPVTRVGKLEVRVPQDRDGRFSIDLFERYQRSEQALVATLAEMYVQGVSTRKVKAEEFGGHAFRPRPSPPSTSVWTKASRPLRDAPSKSPVPISSSMRLLRRCGKAAW